jgi:hypothetical protein
MHHRLRCNEDLDHARLLPWWLQTLQTMGVKLAAATCEVVLRRSGVQHAHPGPHLGYVRGGSLLLHPHLQRVGGSHILCAWGGADAQHIHRPGQQPRAAMQHLQHRRARGKHVGHRTHLGQCMPLPVLVAVAAWWQGHGVHRATPSAAAAVRLSCATTCLPHGFNGTCLTHAAAVLGSAPHTSPPRPPRDGSLWTQQTSSPGRLLCLTTSGQALLGPWRLLLRWMPAGTHQGAVVSQLCGREESTAGSQVMA